MPPAVIVACGSPAQRMSDCSGSPTNWLWSNRAAAAHDAETTKTATANKLVRAFMVPPRMSCSIYWTGVRFNRAKIRIQ
jgi:hypothetical protein